MRTNNMQTSLNVPNRLIV